MQFYGLQCDTCTKVVKIDSPSVYEHLNIPGDWFSVFQGPMSGQEPYQFCSMRCLIEWYAKILSLNEPGEVMLQ